MTSPHHNTIEYKMGDNLYNFYEPLVEESNAVCFDTQLPAGVGSFAQLIGRVRQLIRYLKHDSSFSLDIVEMMLMCATMSTY